MSYLVDTMIGVAPSKLDHCVFLKKLVDTTVKCHTNRCGLVVHGQNVPGLSVGGPVVHG
jgi:hypothetical protein